MLIEPIDEVADFIGFDPSFYCRCLGISVQEAFPHFRKTGRFERRPIRNFRQEDLASAVQFDPGTYRDLHVDVRDDGIDPWQHFLTYGLKEFRSTTRDEVSDDAFWRELGIDDWRLLTSHQQFPRLDHVDPALLARAVRSGLTRRGDVLYRSKLARLLAKASLVLRWPVAAAAFLSTYREAVAFSLPDQAAPPDVFQVCEAVTVREYCERHGIGWTAAEPAIAVANAVVCSDGNVMTSDYVYLTDASWSGAGSARRAALTGPTHRVLTLMRRPKPIPGLSVSLVRKSSSGPFAFVADGMTRLLAANSRMTSRSTPALAPPGKVGHRAEHAAPKGSSALVRGAALWVSTRTVQAVPHLLSAARSMMRGHAQRGSFGSGRAGKRFSADREAVAPAASPHRPTATCLVAADHVDIARALIPKIQPAMTAALLIEAGDVDFATEILIVVGNSSGEPEHSQLPPFASSIPQLRLLVGERPSLRKKADIPTQWTSRSGLLIRSEDPSISGIANGTDVDDQVRKLGLERLAPDWRRAGELAAAVAGAPVLVLGSAADATAIIFARPGTPIVLLGLRTGEFDALRSLTAAAETPVHVVGGLSVSGSVEPEDIVAMIDAGDLHAALQRAVGDDVFGVLLQRRIADLVSAVLSSPADEALEVLQEGAGELAVVTGAVGRSAISPELDAWCVDCAASEWRSRPAAGPAKPGVRVYYATQLLRVGGHTRLIEDLIGARPDDEHHVIVSALPELDAGWPHDLIFRPPGPTTLHVVPVDLNGRLAAVIRLLRQLRPETLFQLAHPNDPVGTAILHPNAAEQLVLVHHNDHSFCLGPTLPGLVRMTLHPRSKRETERLLQTPVAYAPMTSRTDGALVRWRGGDPFLTASSGTQHKFETRNNQRYADLLRVRFNAREGRHVHIGPLEPAFRESIERELDVQGFGKRFIHVEFSTKLIKTLRDLRPHLYVNSYPVGGGLALVDAMAIGLPIASAWHNPSLDSSELLYPGHMSWTHLGELDKILRDFSRAECERHQGLAADYFRSVHAPALFKRNLDQILAVRLLPTGVGS